MKDKLPNFEATLKSTDTEEIIDILFYRPIGYRWAKFFHKLGITPNQITIAAIIIGVAAGYCFYFNSLTATLLGMFLLIWANSYDSADGQLARMTGQKSSLGRILDGVCGDLWFAAIYLAIVLRLQPEWGWKIWLLAAATGYFHARQAAMADYYRNIHLLFLKGISGSELDNSDTLREKYRLLSWKIDPVKKLFETFYLSYTRGQEAWSGNFQTFQSALSERYGKHIPESLRLAFRAKSLPLMKYTNMLSFNTRAIALFVFLLINKPWLYFVFEITVLNVMLLYMVRKHENICKKFVNEIKEGLYD